MGIDLGERRTGIAFSDQTATLSGEAFVLEEYNMERLAQKIYEEAISRNVSEIVLGCPKNMNATEGEKAKKSIAFAETLRNLTGLPVVLWDERLTTVDAHRILHASGKKEKKYRKVIDAVAASIILQNYLDFKNR
ncbi:MAG: Holliday junction resolvase RuvX [Clostridiales bacterium]|nr:Holliday junction resolvase RuvX [Clostridiales bacterium]